MRSDGDSFYGCDAIHANNRKLVLSVEIETRIDRAYRRASEHDSITGSPSTALPSTDPDATG